jgi:hypothetical protein
MAAHRVIAENQMQDAALQLQLALHEHEVWRERFGDLLPASLDLLRHLRITCSAVFAEQRVAALRAERYEGRKSLAEERAALIDEIMLTGEQIDFPPIVTEAFERVLGVFCWSKFCGDASVEHLRLAPDAAHLKLQVKSGRLKLEELESKRKAPAG